MTPQERLDYIADAIYDGMHDREPRHPNNDRYMKHYQRGQQRATEIESAREWYDEISLLYS